MAKKRKMRQYGGPLDAQELLYPINNINLPWLQDGGFQPLPEGYQHQMNFQFPGSNPRHYQQPARDYNEFFGPMAGQMGQIKQTALEANNKPMIVSSMMGLSNLGEYKYNPIMPKSKIPSMKDRGARRMQGLIQGMDPQQINYLGATPPPTNLKSGINYARGLDLRLNQVGPAVESAMYMNKKGLIPKGLPQLGVGDWISNLGGRRNQGPQLDMAQGSNNFEDYGMEAGPTSSGGGGFGEMSSQGMGQGIGAAADFGGGMLGGMDFFDRDDQISKYKADIDEVGAGRQGALTGAMGGLKAGATIGGAFGPLGSLIGGAAGGIAGLFTGKRKGIKNAEALQTQQNERIDDTLSTELTASRLSSLPTATANVPVAEMGGNLPMSTKGGFLKYRGAKHSDPSNGIDVDETGSMSLATGKRPVAKVEDGELSFFDPEEQKPYVLSKKLGFAQQGDKLFKKYDLENRQFGNDKALDDAITAQFMNLKTKQEDMKKTLTPKEPQFDQELPLGQFGFDDNPFGGVPGQYNYNPFLIGQRMQSGTLQNPFLYARDLRMKQAGNTQPDNYNPTQNQGQSQQYTGDFNNPLYDPQAGGAFGGTRGRVFGQANMDPRYNNVGTMQYNPQVGGAFENIWPGLDTRLLSQSPNFNPQKQPPRNQSVLPQMSRSDVQVDVSTPEINTFGSPDTSQISAGIRPKTLNKRQLSKYKKTGVLPEDENYSPTLSPLAHALSGTGNIMNYFAMKNAKPEQYNPTSRGAEQVDYSKDRIASQETAKTSRAVASRNAREAGNVGLAMANQGVTRTGVDRLLGKEISKSIMNEENTNAQLREGANRDNFMAQSQAGLYNNQMMNNYRMRLASMNPWSTGLNTAASYFADNVKQQNYMTAMSMQNPNMETYRDPNANWFNWLYANKGFANRFTGEPINYSPYTEDGEN